MVASSHRATVLEPPPSSSSDVGLPVAVERFAALCARIPLSARLVVDFKRLVELLESLPDDVGRVIRLFDGQRTVHAVLLECSLPEVVTLEAVTRLCAQGVLVPAQDIAGREAPPLVIPPFFEPVLPSRGV